MPTAVPNLTFHYALPPPGAVANASHGSVDNGGPIDHVCAAWFPADSVEGQTAIAMDRSGYNQWSYDNFGVPMYAPSFIEFMNSWVVRTFGTLACAYHGYARSGQRVGPALGWGILGAIFPIIGTSAALLTGYAEPKRSRRRSA